MKKEYRIYQNTLKQISTALIIAFVLQVANNALFIHSHSSIDGTYSHAHPFGGHHSHNDFQASFYDQLQLLSLKDIPSLITPCSFELQYSFKDYPENQLSRLFALNIKGRAPPVC